MPVTSEELFLINVRTYQPPNILCPLHSIWHKVPVARRSAVFVLLFLGNMGELRVILTKRSSKLRSFPGHISLPGGKADSGLETEWQVARREMEEEIGLEANNEKLMKHYGFKIDHLNLLPCYLSRTFLAVKPCIGFMNLSSEHEQELFGNLKLNLNPDESSSIFSCPLKDFLYPSTKSPSRECIKRQFFKIEWGGIPWNLRSYTFPHENEHEIHWLREVSDTSMSSEDEPEENPSMKEKAKAMPKRDLSTWGRLGTRRDSDTDQKINDVWGLTANILHDLAQIIYCQPTVYKNKTFGEEELINSVFTQGNIMQEKKRSEEEVKLIHSKTINEEFGFNSILPKDEFLRLKEIYRH